MGENIMTNLQKTIQFTRSKDFKYIKTLGSGGTGATFLLLDEVTDMQFAFKKFQPIDKSREDDYFERFVDEIKILFRLYHPNIVRIFNYYLYPEQKTGYIQMEYIQGSDIQEYRANSSSNEWNQIFIDLIQTFKYLEINKILHRDIRPQNIMINVDGVMKVIDFGFGKNLPKGSVGGSTVWLNWPVSEYPDEIKVQNPKYTHQTEIYFLGKLLKSLKLSSCRDFRFDYIINKMCKQNPDERYDSFISIADSITKKDFKLLEFDENEKLIYKNFADALSSIISKHHYVCEPVLDVQTVILRLEKFVKYIDLEENVQYLPKIISCFLDNEYSWYLKREIKTKTIIDFYKMLVGFDDEKQQAVLDNITLRLKKIDATIPSEDLPF
jgi:eukaryotic-like serine/threonine-protein kinase